MRSACLRARFLGISNARPRSNLPKRANLLQRAPNDAIKLAGAKRTHRLLLLLPPLRVLCVLRGSLPLPPKCAKFPNKPTAPVTPP